MNVDDTSSPLTRSPTLRRSVPVDAAADEGDRLAPGLREPYDTVAAIGVTDRGRNAQQEHLAARDEHALAGAVVAGIPSTDRWRPVRSTPPKSGPIDEPKRHRRHPAVTA
jgi:hypothetical protein